MRVQSMVSMKDQPAAHYSQCIIPSALIRVRPARPFLRPVVRGHPQIIVGEGGSYLQVLVIHQERSSHVLRNQPVRHSVPDFGLLHPVLHQQLRGGQPQMDPGIRFGLGHLLLDGPITLPRRGVLGGPLRN